MSLVSLGPKNMWIAFSCYGVTARHWAVKCVAPVQKHRYMLWPIILSYIHIKRTASSMGLHTDTLDADAHVTA